MSIIFKLVQASLSHPLGRANKPLESLTTTLPRKIMSQFSDKTYNAKKYAQLRPKYPSSLFEKLREYIGLEPNEKVTLGVDLGCGPGEATSVLVEKVANKMFGFDPSEVMLSAAKDTYPELTDKIHWIVGDDTTLTAKADSNSVDIVTVAEAAHWLTYPDFWEASHQVLKPKTGVLAYWGYYNFHFVGYPESRRIISDFGSDDDKCQPYWAPGMHLLRDLYRDLIPPSNLFSDIQVYRDGQEEPKGENPFELIVENVTVRDALGILSTYSAYHDWKEANPGKPDIVEATTNELLKKTGLTLDSTVTVKYNTVLILARKI